MIKFYSLIHFLLIFSYWLLITNVTLKILTKCKTVSSIIAWILVVYVLPVLGVIVYLLFYELNLEKRRIELTKINWFKSIKLIKKSKKYNYFFTKESSDVAKSLFRLCEYKHGLSGLKGNQIKLLVDTDNTLQTLINDINSAKNSIDMIFYIWRTGGLVDLVLESLIVAAKRGVKCRLILDHVGSISFFCSSYPKLMRNAGINIVEALKINILHIFLRRMDLRQHRKMILIDNCISYIGSMNMVDPNLFKNNLKIGQWFDLMIRIKGPVVVIIGFIFSYDWEIETGEHILPSLNDNNLSYDSHSKHVIQVIASGPGFFEDTIHQALLTSIYAARKQLIITTPYLVPSNNLIQAICTAAQIGVEVCIIIPRYNDSILVNWASRSFFTKLLKSGVLIYQFEEGLLHTKSIVIDKQLSLLGTVNLDMRSLWLNFEITLIIDDTDFSSDLLKIQENYIAKSKLIEVNKWINRPYWKRVIERLFYLISPLL